MSDQESAPHRRGRALLAAAAVLVVALGVFFLVRAAGDDDSALSPPVEPTPSAATRTSGAPSSPASTSPIPGPASTQATRATPVPPSSAPPTATVGTSAPAPSVPAPTATGPATVVPTASVSTERAPLREKKELDNGVVISVARLESVDGEARGPGEVAGPALRVSILVQNKSRQEISMELALVNVYYGKEGTPASPLSGPGAMPLEGAVEAGGSETGRYVFNVPKDQRDDVLVEFSYTTDAPTVIFSGAV